MGEGKVGEKTGEEAEGERKEEGEAPERSIDEGRVGSLVGKA